MIKFTITIQEGETGIGCRGDSEHFDSTEEEKWHLALFFDAFTEVGAMVRDVNPEGFTTVEGTAAATGPIIDDMFKNL